MLKLFEAFSGYKSQSMALKKYGVTYESVGISEIDEAAIIASAAVHCDMSIEMIYPPIDKILERFIARNISFNFKTGVNPWVKILERGRYSEKLTIRIHTLFKACILSKNFGDISRVDPGQVPDHDLFTYSFPCQDISMAGEQKGLEEGSGSRSSLLWECQKIIELKRPKYLMMENVKNLVGKKHKPDFDRWLELLEGLGYQNHWKVINAKYCGVPQNRERVFCISILGGGNFSFYDDFDSGVRLKDILENDVDEKYYLSEDKAIKFTENLTNKRIVDKLPKGKELKIVGTTQNPEAMGTNFRSWCYSPEGLVGCLSATQYKEPTQIVEACRIVGRNPDNPKARIVGDSTVQMLEVSKDSTICNCVSTVQKGSMVLEKTGCEQRSDEGLRFFKDDCIGTIRTIDLGGDKRVLEEYSNQFRIRKLTPKECFRLMGVSDSDIDKIQATGISNSQQYKMTGNSIVVDCMKFLDQLHK